MKKIKKIIRKPKPEKPKRMTSGEARNLFNALEEVRLSLHDLYAKLLEITSQLGPFMNDADDIPF